MFFFSLFSLNGSSKRIEYSPVSIPGIYTLSRSELTELYENRVKLSAYDLYPPYIQLRILWNMIILLSSCIYILHFRVPIDRIELACTLSKRWAMHYNESL